MHTVLSNKYIKYKTNKKHYNFIYCEFSTNVLDMLVKLRIIFQISPLKILQKVVSVLEEFQLCFSGPVVVRCPLHIH